jgi:dihydrolipoamide dehydrogenase
MVPKIVPKSLIIMGSGAIGVEFASFYRSLGSDVTIVELLTQMLPLEDAEISALARKRFEAEGIRIMTGTKVTKVKKGDNSVVARVENERGEKSILKAERLISAVGVVGNTENLGLEKIGVEVGRGYIQTDGLCRTNVPGIYAIGDVAGPPMLAHKAEHEGVLCVEAIKGLRVHPMDKERIPGCVYTHPQIASVGLTEAEAFDAGYEVKVGRFPFAGNGKAIALGETDGMIKTVFDGRTGELLGAHMIGAEVTELIHGYVTAMTLETTERELSHTVYPHPTLSEMLHESALDAYGHAIHK